MPHALLLSPDDQAVSAITGVLEEMSVSCERPLDGVSAAQKLNSRSFDLVLVDCENLPAAKLIFDVCRRGKHGTNPVPIAIVDGRAGLPTAFRLGAELILTKPVAKDQARSTVRTAVSRLRKEDPARAVQTSETAPSVTPASMPEARAQAAAAAVSSPPMSMPDVTSTPAMDPLPAVAMSTATEEIVTPPTLPLPEVSPSKPLSAEDLFVAPEPAPAEKLTEKLSEDPVLADLTRAEVEPAPAPVFSSYAATKSKSRGPLIVVLILILAGAGFYAAWMTQPGFRTLVQPQIDRVLGLVGLASQPKAVPAPPVPAPDPARSFAKPTPGTPATPAPVSTDAAPPKGASTLTDSSDTPPGSTAPAPAATTPAPDSAPPAAKPESLADPRKTEAQAALSDGEVSGDQAAIILSSKGAEKRLLYQVPPTLPKQASGRGLQGTVVLKTMVDDAGKVESVHMIEGNPALADAAADAVKQWRYRPYVRDGKSLPFQTVVLVDFQHP